MRSDLQLVTVLAFVVLFVFAAIVRRRGRGKRAIEPAHRTAGTTMKVPVLKRPARVDEDIEGKTVPARMAPSEAYQLHERYAPAFDQQAAIHRYEQTYGHEQDVQQPSEDPAFDQAQYAQALDAFPDEPRTTLGHAAPKQRLARGSVNEPQYRQYGVQPARPPGHTTLRGPRPARAKLRNAKRS